MTAGAEGQRLAEHYRRRFANMAEYRDAVWRELCAGFFSRHISAGATVLDLGSGWGEFIRNVSATRKYALDLNPDAQVRAAEGVTSLAQDCSEEWPLADQTLDVVFTSNLLEHLPSKAHIERTVEQAHRCLRPGGQFICLGPNIRYVGGAYWDFWDHHIPLTDGAMTELLLMSGFTIEKRISRFLPYTMSTGRTYPVVFVKLYLRFPIFWRFFGRQFLVVARKPRERR